MMGRVSGIVVLVCLAMACRMYGYTPIGSTVMVDTNGLVSQPPGFWESNLQGSNSVVVSTGADGRAKIWLDGSALTLGGKTITDWSDLVPELSDWMTDYPDDYAHYTGVVALAEGALQSGDPNYVRIEHEGMVKIDGILDVVGTGTGSRFMNVRTTSTNATADTFVRTGYGHTGTKMWSFGRRASSGAFMITESATLAGSQRVVVLPGGNTGIGTNAPSERLHVNGNILATGSVFSLGTNLTELAIEALPYSAFNSFTGSLGSAAFSHANDYATAAQGVLAEGALQVGDLNYVRTNHTGNLELDGFLGVTKNIDVGQDLILGRDLYLGNELIGGSASFSGNLSSSNLTAGGNATVGGTLGVTGAANLSSTLAVANRLTVGTTLQPDKIFVYGNTTTDQNYLFRNANPSGGNSQLFIDGWGAGNQSMGFVLRDFATGGVSNRTVVTRFPQSHTSVPSRFRIDHRVANVQVAIMDIMPDGALTYSVPTTERFRIGADGNVGIGTTTPSERLSVTGNATVSGNITAGGTLSASQITLGGETRTNWPTMGGGGSEIVLHALPQSGAATITPEHQGYIWRPTNSVSLGFSGFATNDTTAGWAGIDIKPTATNFSISIASGQEDLVEGWPDSIDSDGVVLYMDYWRGKWKVTERGATPDEPVLRTVTNLVYVPVFASSAHITQANTFTSHVGSDGSFSIASVVPTNVSAVAVSFILAAQSTTAGQRIVIRSDLSNLFTQAGVWIPANGAYIATSATLPLKPSARTTLYYNSNLAGTDGSTRNASLNITGYWKEQTYQVVDVE